MFPYILLNFIHVSILESMSSYQYPTTPPNCHWLFFTVHFFPVLLCVMKYLSKCRTMAGVIVFRTEEVLVLSFWKPHVLSQVMIISAAMKSLVLA